MAQGGTRRYGCAGVLLRFGGLAPAACMTDRCCWLWLQPSVLSCAPMQS